MFTLLDYYTTLEILKYLDVNSLVNLSIAETDIRNYYADYIYYRHSLECKTVEFLDFFVSDTISFPVYNPQLQKLMDYIAGDSSLCIAGGFPTQLYMGRQPKLTSDIDIYALCGNHIQEDSSKFKRNDLIHIENLLLFILENYTDPTFCSLGGAVFNISVQEFSHPIQIIVTGYKSLAQILSSFDNSHNRCGIYMGRSYVGIDAELTHRTMTTYFYKTTKPVRYTKALEMGFKIFGFSDIELALITSKVNHVEHENINNSLTAHEINYILNQICYDVSPSDNWMTGYTDAKLPEECFISVKVDLTSELSTVFKSSYMNGIFGKYTTATQKLNPRTILKSPNSLFLHIFKEHRYDLGFTIIGTFDTSKGRWIKVDDVGLIEKLKVVKENLLEIFKSYYGEIPDKIKRCRCLTTWDEFLEYRKELAKPLKYNRVNNVWKGDLWSYGWEYNDSIIIYEKEAYIKAIKHNQVMSNVPSETKVEFTLTTVPERTKEGNVYSWGSYEFTVTHVKNI
jgi:hypothetical protein